MGWNLETNVKGPTNGMTLIQYDHRQHGGVGSFPPQTITTNATYNWYRPAGATIAHIAHGVGGMTDAQWTYCEWTLIIQRASTGGYENIAAHGNHTDGDTYQSFNANLQALVNVSNETHLNIFVNAYSEGGWVNTSEVGIQVAWYGPSI